jgi:O-antigen/teichoic acid export membrane protein
MSKLQLTLKQFSYSQLMTHLRTPLYRNGYALILSTGITSALGLLYWAVAAKFYSTESVGLNSAVVSTMIFLSGISQLNMQETMIRYIPVMGRRTTRMVIYTYIIVISLSALVGAIFYFGIPLWSPSLSFLSQSPALALWFIMAVVIWGIFVLQDSVLTGLRQALWIPAENAAFSIIKIVLLIALATLIPASGIFISWSVSVLIIIIPISFLLFRRLIPHHVAIQPAQESAIPLRQISKYIAGNYAAALLSNMASTLLPLIITQVEGAEANAHFYLAWTIASALQIMTSNMATSLTVEASLDNANVESYRRRALVGIFRLILPAALGLIVLAPIILRLVGQGYVAEGAPLMQLLALAAIPNVYNAVYISMSRTKTRVGAIVAIYGANAFLVLGLSHFFLPFYGITGVGLAWVISQCAIALTLMARTRLQSVRVKSVVMAEAE